jgi:glycerol-3-phosphate dehydrogenase
MGSDENAEYDVAVIGGGVNGTGVARDCALRGLKVVLFERNDLAFGASGNSSGMIHGGPRYLTMDPDVTYTSCLDSGHIQKIAPHLLFRVPFILPVNKGRGSRNELDLLDAFFDVYDKYQPLKGGKPHVRLRGDEVRSLEPGLAGDLEGGVTFDEYGVDGVRLCVANALDAAGHGAQVLVPASVTSIQANQKGCTLGYQLRQGSSVTGGRVSAKRVVNATGAWAPLTASFAQLPKDAARVRPGKGIHIYLDRRISNYAVMVKAIDGRRVFMEPWQNTTVIGTTDDDYYGDLDNVFATRDEAQYLMQALSGVFPTLKQARPVGTWSGVRPTLFEWGKTEDELSREHTIVDHAPHGAPGLYSMLGGKLASYRLFAEEMSDTLCQSLGHSARCRTSSSVLPGGEPALSVQELASRAGLEPLAASRILYRHGARAERILERIERTPADAEVVCICEPVTLAEVREVIESEWATDVDAVSRRTRLGLGPCGGMRCAQRCGQVVAQETGRSPAEGRELAAEFLRRGLKHRLPVLGPKQVRQEAIALGHHRAQLGLAPGGNGDFEGGSKWTS